MKLEDLPTPGAISNSITLSKEVLRAVNYAEVQADMTGGKSEAGLDLSKFFAQCAKHCAALTKTSKEK